MLAKKKFFIFIDENIRYHIVKIKPIRFCIFFINYSQKKGTRTFRVPHVFYTVC